MHGYTLKVVTIRKYKVGLKFQPTFTKTSKNAHNLIVWEEFIYWHQCLLRCFIRIFLVMGRLRANEKYQVPKLLTLEPVVFHQRCNSVIRQNRNPLGWR